MTYRSDHCDVIVIGAGPGGAVASAMLARDGLSVRCVERARFPRHVIGESLLPRCNRLLKEAGLLESVAARGYMVKSGATFFRGSDSFRFVFADGLRGDEPSTFQVPRDDFDRVLATAAADAGATVEFGVRVDDVAFDSNGATVMLSSTADETARACRARHVLDCSGPALVLPRILGLVEESSLPPRVASYAYFREDARSRTPADGDIWIGVLPEDGWVWLIPFSSGVTSVGVVCARDHWDRLPGTDLDKYVRMLASEPNVTRRLAVASRVDSPRSITNYSVSVQALSGTGWALVGNAGGFLDPVFSSGVTLAMESAVLAARLTKRHLTKETVDWAAEFDMKIRGATDVFQAFVESWYQREFEAIVFAKRKLPRIVRQITSILGGNVLRDDNSLLPDPRSGLRQIVRTTAASS
jgi:flavin-dependent dehydrogenase